MTHKLAHKLMRKPVQKLMQKSILGLVVLFSASFTQAAGPDKGIGPFTEVTIEAKVNSTLADKGKGLFTSKCGACHKIEERYVGPALKGVTTRRAPEWIMNMMMNPAEMIEKNETAKEMYGEYLVPMTFQNITKDDARAIFEYFRQQDSKK